MKLSAKWLTALAAVALLVVAVVGLSRPSSAATGSVYVANEWSKITNESPAPTGYLTGSTVYSTYLTSSRLIQASSNKLKIVVVDSDLNTTTTVIDTNSGSGFTLPASPTLAVGGSIVLTLTDATKPIAGALSDIKLFTHTTTTQVSTSIFSVVDKFDGDGTVPGWIKVQRNSGSTSATVDISYPTSLRNTTSAATSYVADVVRVTSDVGGASSFVQLLETGLNTGRFEGYVDIVQSTGTDANGAVSGTTPGTGTIRAVNGPITINYNDAGTTRSAVSVLDISAPTVAVTGPAHNSATQNRLPTFSGTVTDAGSGLKLVQQVVSSVNVGPANQFVLAIDKTDDPSNGTRILDAAGTIQGSGNAAESVSLGTVTDGQTSLSFSHQVTAQIPSIGTTVPDHNVDWQVKAVDLAGNLGFSDSDTGTTVNATAPVGAGTVVSFEAHVVKIDQKIPSFLSSTTTPALAAGDHKTGIALDAAGAETADKTSLRVKFNDKVAAIDASDFTVTFDNGSSNTPVSATVKDEKVYLKLATNIPANDTPLVALQGQITDLAGNATSTGSTAVADGIKPTLTVTLSGGSGTGTGAEAATSLTKKSMTVNVTSDETLSGSPSVKVHPYNATTYTPTTAQTKTLTVLSTGTNTWTATFDGSALYDDSSTSIADGDLAIIVSGGDAALAASPAADAANTGTAGAVTTKSFKLDESLAAATVTVSGGTTTSIKKPIIKIAFADASSVTISEIKLGPTGGTAVDMTTSLVRGSDAKTFFLVPTSNLANGSHTVSVAIGKASDAAANTNAAAISQAFTVKDRATFDVSLFAGWNLISFPSTPVDPLLGSVFTNVGVDQVIAYDATNATNPWRIATRDATSGAFTSSGTNPLSSIAAGQGYWVHTNNFEPVKVLLTGPTEPGAGSPPAVASIPLAKGWNLIGVVDTSKTMTEGAAGVTVYANAAQYFNGAGAPTNTLGRVARAYKYDATLLTFTAIAGNTALNTGDGIWMFVNASADGSVSAITP